MICKSCQIAGDMVAVARDKFEDEFLNIEGIEVYTKEAVRSVAHLFHGLCKGSGHCDCQHKVDFEGKALQKK